MASAAAPIDGRSIETDDARWRGPLFVLTIFVGSFLLFLVQPMIARMALPRLGGAPAVWNSAMLIYQALLLGGYSYAHLLGRLNVMRQALVHAVLLCAAALWLPIGLAAIYPSATANPALWVPWLLLVSIGPLFFAVSAQAPLIQRWYSAASGGRDPYALYAASNLGSFAGLLAYPLFVEPGFALAAQSRLWSIGYGVLILLVIACATLLPRHDPTRPGIARPSEPPPLRRQLYWVLLAFVPSGLMLSTTTYITTDIVAMPLLWVLPLGLYLLSFSVAFSTRGGIARTITFIAPFALLICGAVAIRNNPAQPFFSMAVGLLLLFIVAVALHGEMYRTRPAPERLTGFYLAMSLGGALGGLFAGLFAPLLFDWTYEHPLLLLLAGCVVPMRALAPALQRVWNDDRRATLLTAVAVGLVFLFAAVGLAGPAWLGGNAAMITAVGIGLIGMLAVGRRIPFVACLLAIGLVLGVWHSFELSAQPGARTRSYFGIYTVRDMPADGVRSLAHGTTQHGVEITVPGRETEPTAYYGRRSGIGQAMLALPALAGADASVGVVGLGTGTLACYARGGQSWRFFEIDPAVLRIARDDGAFHFLGRCLPHVPVIIGDARLTLAARPEGQFDLLALDAFSSDVVPMHLLTVEAFANYARVVSRDGLLLVHISNRFLDLRPVIAGAAASGGWTAAVYHDEIDRDARDQRHLASSVWVAMSRNPASLARLTALAPAGETRWQPLSATPGFTPWTDDFASILPLLTAGVPKADAAP
ncbi:spermidine synthase [Sphingomonas flavalba]|uniref:spermidine synthase n=1 Tax=Sphingomonas flavalba TaxID=2559804 RepID=UPI0039DF944B